MADLIGIYDHATGETIVREMTDDEQAERDAQIAAKEAAKEAAEKEAADKAAAKASAEAKLAALGLTEAEIVAIRG